MCRTNHFFRLIDHADVEKRKEIAVNLRINEDNHILIIMLVCNFKM